MSPETRGLLLALLLIALGFCFYRRIKTIGLFIVLAIAMVTWLGGHNWQRLKHAGFTMKGGEVSLGIDFDGAIEKPEAPRAPSDTSTTPATPGARVTEGFTKNVGRMPAAVFGSVHPF